MGKKRSPFASGSGDPSPTGRRGIPGWSDQWRDLFPEGGAGLNASAALFELRSPSAGPNAPSRRSTHQGLHRLWAPLPVAEKVEGRMG